MGKGEKKLSIEIEINEIGSRKLVGLGLRECQVRLVTYFWSSKEFRTLELGNTPLDIPEVPRAPLRGRDPRSPLPALGRQGGTRSVALAPGAVAARLLQSLPSRELLDDSWKSYRRFQRPRRQGSPGIQRSGAPARRPRGARWACRGRARRGPGTDLDPGRRPGQGALGAPGDRRLLRCLPGAALGAAAADHAEVCGPGPLEVAEHLRLPGAQPARGRRGAARVRGCGA